MGNDSTKICPNCKGAGGFGIKGNFMAWDICKTCKGLCVVPA